jgi:hypothetical protein
MRKIEEDELGDDVGVLGRLGPSKVLVLDKD